MNKSCSNCKWCMRDFSTDTIDCNLPYKLEKELNPEWVHQESEDYFSPCEDYCTVWEEDIDPDPDYPF